MNNFDPMTGQPINNNQNNQNNQNNNQNNGYNPNQNYNQNHNSNYNQNYNQNYNPNYNQNNYNTNNGYRPPNPGYTPPNGYPNGGYNNGYGYPNRPNGRLPIQSRNIVMYILLSLVTCGIFGFYWMYCVNEDVNNSLGENDMSSGMVVLLTIITCGIYGFVWAYMLGNKISRLKRMMGDPYAESSLGALYLVLCIFITYIVPLAIAQSELNKYAEFRE